MSLLKKFSSNVKTARVAQGLSQSALATKVGLSVSYISMLERGQRSPPLETVEKLSKGLKIPPATLLA